VIDITDDSSKRRIYTLNGLPPEIVAVAFAKTSRSPDSFDKIAQELTEESSRQFHEKWIVGYGHSSVAEHAVLSIALENVSILATKVLEDNRLASYTEKSTRYQVFNKERCFRPKKVIDSNLGPVYEKAIDEIMDIYIEMFPKLVEFFKNKIPQKEDEPDRLYDVRTNNRALDCARYVLPACVLTNLGMTLNARNLENGIAKLMTHPLDEMREIGEEIKQASLKVTPTLVKYCDFNKYIDDTNKALKEITDNTIERSGAKNDKQSVKLVDYDKDAEDKIVCALLYRYAKEPYEKIKEKVNEMSDEEKQKIFDESLKRLNKFDRPIREMEYCFYTFDVLMDYGAFRDIQRHRMCTQSNQDITVDNGYETPEEIVEAGLKEDYDKAMNIAETAFKEIEKEFPVEAGYIVPMAYRKRTLMKINLRAAMHLIKLRSGPTGHTSYRQVAQQMYEEIKKVHPFLAKYIKVDLD